MKKIQFLALVALASASVTANAQFSTPFNSDAVITSDFTVLAGDSTGTTGLAAVNALTDVNVSVGSYGAIPTNNAANPTVPEAPRSNVGGGDTATTGLIINVVSNTSAADGVTVTYNGTLPTNYSVTFDYFNAYNGGGGSTEAILIGANTTGTTFIGETNSTTPTPKDGYVFTAYGDADVTGPDYLIGEGSAGGFIPGGAFIDGTALTGVTWGDGQSPDVSGRDFGATLFSNATPTAVPAGSLQNTWTTFKVSYIGGILSISMNGTLIVTYVDPDNTFATGKFTIGHEDIFLGGGVTNFGIFDNFTVEDETVASVDLWNVYN